MGLGFGYGHTFGAKTTLHADTQLERATGYVSALSLFEGVEYQFTPNIALDLSAQHLNATGGTLDHQILMGLTVNFGRPSTWFTEGPQLSIRLSSDRSIVWTKDAHGPCAVPGGLLF